MRANTRDIFNAVSREQRDIAPEMTFVEEVRTMENRRAMLRPKVPRTFEEFESLITRACEESRTYYRGIVSIDGRPCAAAFLSEAICSMARRVTNVAFDGTFYVTPKPFTQLFTIFFKIGRRFFPAASFLMMDKNYGSYKGVFDYMTRNVTGLNPEKAIADFEAASRRAFGEKFPNTTLSGCFFHYLQACQRYIKSNKLRKFYCGRRPDPTFKSWYSLLVYCVTLPQEKVVNTFNMISQHQFPSPVLHNQSQKFVQYMRRVWMSTPFKINMFDHSVSTNNGAEAYHRRLLDVIKQKKNIWDFLVEFGEIIQDHEMDAQRESNGLLTTRAPGSLLFRDFDTHKQDLQNGVIDEVCFLSRVSNSPIDPGLPFGQIEDADSEPNIMLETPRESDAGETDDELPDLPISTNISDHSANESTGLIIESNRVQNDNSELFARIDEIIGNRQVDAVMSNGQLLDSFNGLQLFESAIGRSCSVCWLETAGNVRLSCSHVSVCSTCITAAIELLISDRSSQKYKCPVCREIITGFLSLS